jgi:heptosyltransferase-2
MNVEVTETSQAAAQGRRPILVVPYMWIGDFVRSHTVVKLLNVRFPGRPVDMLATELTAPLVDYMPGLRKAITSDLPRGRLALAKQRELARRLRRERYATALVLPRTWKSALAPFLAGIPERVGFVGEARFVLLNDLRRGERSLARMIDRCGALALPGDAGPPATWPLPELAVPDAEVIGWRARAGLTDGRLTVAVCPGAIGPGKRWPTSHYAELARRLTADGISVWVLGAPGERALASSIAAAAGALVHDFTGPLRDNVLALKAANAAVANDSGLLHVAAAVGTPAVAIYGPSDPLLWAPLNPVAAIVQPPSGGICPTCGRSACRRIDHRRTEDIPVGDVHDAVRGTLGG